VVKGIKKQDQAMQECRSRSGNWGRENRCGGGEGGEGGEGGGGFQKQENSQAWKNHNRDGSCRVK
jgi:hypothetical protein